MPEVGVLTGNFERYYTNGLTPEKIFGVGNDPYNGTWAFDDQEVPRRDEVLNQKFGGGARAIEGYMRLLNDCSVLSALDKFIAEIIQRPIIVTPASSSAKDEYIAEFVRQCIYRIGMTSRQSRNKITVAYNSDGFNQICKGLAESYILGIAGAGIVWVKQGKYILPNSVQSIDPRRINVTINGSGDVVPKLTVWQDGYNGIDLPIRTFILHRHWSNIGYVDPWGMGLGRQLYPLVEFRRNLISMWLQYCDKNTTPNVVGTYPLGIGKEDHQKIFDTMKTFGQQTIALFPEGVNVNYLTPSSSAPQIYQSLIGYLDNQISWLITGERDNSQSGQATGSLPQQDRLADSTRVKKAKSFNDGLENTINNTLVRWLVELNFGFDVTPPQVTRNFSDITDRTNKQALLGQLSMLKGLGYVINDLDWVKEQLDIPSLAYDPAVATAQQGQPTEEDAAPATPAESPGEPQNVEGGKPAESYAEGDDDLDLTSGSLPVSDLAAIVNLPLEKIMETLQLEKPTDLVDLTEFTAKFLDNQEQDLAAKLKAKFVQDNPSPTDYVYKLPNKLRSNEENLQDFDVNDPTSGENANEAIAVSLRGTPQQIGFDALTNTTTSYEQGNLNLSVDNNTPVYEILQAIADALSSIKLSQSRDIKPNITSGDWQKIGKYERQVNSYLQIYTTQNVRYSALILKESVRELEHILYSGFKPNILNYDEKLTRVNQ